MLYMCESYFDPPTDSGPHTNTSRLSELSEQISALDTRDQSLRAPLGEVQDNLASFANKFADFLDRAKGVIPGGQLNVSGNYRFKFFS